ncbi:AP2-like ethylene-responsive transcription factor PLT1 [Cryptomeria japonica]|uniref:AP2-like ethylene-responsive transcription factor PLT1 n=1 Tax=Cryptomeria japonica TaxID=3369 RepID=UPI0027DA9B11|nr:AP2-like ethylene-responsive transcription factor PLT1 [Cryptomeria japonica]
MGSMNNWLAFSLASHLDMQGQQHCPNQSGVDASNMILSNFSQSDVNGYGSCSSTAFELPSNTTTASLGMGSLRSDNGSLCLFEAINRTHNAAEWHQKSLSCQTEAIKPEIMTNVNSNDQKRPKLEDFLGGSFVGVHFSEDSEAHNLHTSELDQIYGKAPVFSRDSDHSSAMKTGIVGDHMQINGASDLTTDSSKHSQDLSDQANASTAMQDLYNNSGEAYNLFSDCSLQLSQSSVNNNNNMYDLSDFKTWLRSQSSEEPKLNSNSNSFPTSTAPVESETTANKGRFALAIPANTQSKSPAAALATTSSQKDNSNEDISPSSESKKRSLEQAIVPVEQSAAKKSLDTFGQRTSIYRGVTRHRWTGRYEAHLWDNSCRRDGQTRKGRQVYLGGYDKEEKAARAYDLAALKYWGPSTTTNIPISNYEKELEEMKHMSRQEYVASLRRKSSGFSRGASIYRGVTRHHQHGRWQARIGRVAGNKDLYLGTFSTQEEAAEAYDIAAIKFRGLNAVTNFDMSRYDVKSIINSALPIGGLAKRIKEAESAHLERTVDGPRIVHDEDSTLSSQTHDPVSYGNASAAAKAAHEWPLLAFQQQANSSMAAAYQQRGLWWKQANDNQTHQDYQIQLHQKYLHPSMLAGNGTVLHNLMGLESAEANSSTAGIYNDISNTLAANGLMMQNSSVTQSANSSVVSATHFSDNSEGSVASKAASTYENMMSADPSGRGLYYLTQQQLGRVGYENLTCNNNWMTPSLQTLGSKPNLAVCHAPVFTVWSDT